MIKKYALLSNFPSFRMSILAASVMVASAAMADADLEELIVTSTRSDSLEAAVNVYRIQEQQIAVVSPVHPQELFSRIPGIGMQRGNGQESLMAIRSPVLTGPGACGNFLIMEEGIAVRGSGFCNVNELFDTHYEQAQALEVVRGTNTVFYGSNALTGAINVLLPAKGRDEISIEAGPDDYIRSSVAWDYEQDEENYGRFYLTVMGDGGYRDDSGYDQYKMSWRHKGVWSGWSAEPGLTVTRLQQETAGFVVGTGVYREKRLSRQNPNPEAYRDTDSARVWLKLGRSLSSKETAQLNPYLRYTNMDFLQHFLPGTPLESNNQLGLGWQSSYRVQLDQNLHMTLGFDGELSSGDLKQSQAQDTFTRFGTTFINGPHYDYSVDSESFALFSHWQWQPSDQWLLLAGVRAEYIAYDYDNHLPDGRVDEFGVPCDSCRYSRPADRSDDFDRVSPRFEVQYQLSGNLKLHANWGDVYRAPNSSELYRLQGAQAVADLDMVTAESSEVGASWSSNNTSLALTYYQIDIDNQIITDSSRAKLDGVSTTSEGVELIADYDLTKSLSLALVGNWADHEYNSSQSVLGGSLEPGNQVDTAPSFFGSGFARWSSDDGHFAEIEWQRVGRYYTDPTNTREYPGHSLLHVRASFQVSEPLQLSLRAINLTDKRYADRADVSFGNDRYFPGMPRSLYLGASYSF